MFKSYHKTEPLELCKIIGLDVIQHGNVGPDQDADSLLGDDCSHDTSNDKCCIIRSDMLRPMTLDDTFRMRNRRSRSLWLLRHLQRGRRLVAILMCTSCHGASISVL